MFHTRDQSWQRLTKQNFNSRQRKEGSNTCEGPIHETHTLKAKDSCSLMVSEGEIPAYFSQIFNRMDNNNSTILNSDQVTVPSTETPK